MERVSLLSDDAAERVGGRCHGFDVQAGDSADQPQMPLTDAANRLAVHSVPASSTGAELERSVLMHRPRDLRLHELDEA